MLVALASALASGAMGQGPLANATLEAFTIHVRAVMDFLYSDNPRQDDVVAEDFLPKATWSSIRPKITRALATARARAGKEVAHLTYARLLVTPEAKPWPFVQIAQDISAAFRVFLENVPKGKLDGVWYGGVSSRGDR